MPRPEVKRSVRRPTKGLKPSLRSQSVIRTLARKVDDETLVDALCDMFSGPPVPLRSF